MQTIKTITQFHRLLSLLDPLHPLVSVVRAEQLIPVEDFGWDSFALDFYTVSLKKDVRGKGKYGQQQHDFDKGIMSFTAPRQLQSHEMPGKQSAAAEIGTGYVLLFHPDFLGRHPLAAKIKTYGYFSYAVHEALHLSGQEENNIIDVLKKIELEYAHIDRHTQEIILSQIEVLLNYANRFYERQFITRNHHSSDLLEKVEAALAKILSDEHILEHGLPSVDALAFSVHVSANYLSDLLRAMTGRNAQQHIHEALIEKAKEYLATTNLSIAEIAYRLGFEYPQSFNKLFKKKTLVTPLDFRSSLN